MTNEMMLNDLGVAERSLVTLLGLVDELAGLPVDGETVDGEEFEWENDDAWSTLHGFISAARVVLDRGGF